VPQWDAEEVVGADRAAQLIRAQFPDVPARTVELVSEGWDYAVYRVDGEWAFRFPRREVVVAGTRRELDVLPRLAPALPVAIPVPVLVGEFPWPFYGAPFLPGREAVQSDAGAVAADLGRVLRALHDVELEAELPVDPLGRIDMTIRVPRTREQLRQHDVDAGALLSEAASLPPAGHGAVCHGDLHVRQLLVADGRLSGVVDWVDVCRSDPAVDLSVAWSFLDADARLVFFAEYGPIDRAREVRARVVALFLSAHLVEWARAENVPAVLETASAGLRRAAQG
jgi:aminoglycoside phosphotransferase (APT) family kinase protein